MAVAGSRLVCGLDEAGRGALAGPVVAAAVVLPEEFKHPEIADSKRLPAATRERLAAEIVRVASAWGLGLSTPLEVTRLNVLRASMLAMERAYAALAVRPEVIVADGPHYPSALPPGRALVRADCQVTAVSAASIVAKVHRDALMREYGERFPQFGFARHKGYATPQHISELVRHGPTAIHRTSFRPVAEARKHQMEVV